MVVLASATGRTLVLPPDNPLYLLHKDKANKHRGIQNFFQGFDDVVDVISTEEFFYREMIQKKAYALPTDAANRTRVLGSLKKCFWMKKSDASCITLFDYLTEVAEFVPNWHGEHHCLIMDNENWYRDKSGGELYGTQAQRQYISKFCAKRKPIYYDRRMHDAPLVHFHSHFKNTRLLLHFYAFVHFTNPRVGNYYKRLVRDRVRYTDEIFCAAGKIVKSLIDESSLGIKQSDGDAGGIGTGYIAMHIRRGRVL